MFYSISFFHIYKEIKFKVDSLSKESISCWLLDGEGIKGWFSGKFKHPFIA
jgi:hypothetical protein